MTEREGLDLAPPSPAPDVGALEHDAAIEAMVAWFFANFEDPAEETPWDEGEYVFIWGGPYDAEDELEDAFGGQASDQALEAAVERIAEEGWQWAPSSDRIVAESVAQAVWEQRGGRPRW